MTTRSTQIQVRVSPEEKDELAAKAAAYDISISEYLRLVGLERDETKNGNPPTPRKGPVSRLTFGSGNPKSP